MLAYFLNKSVGPRKGFTQILNPNAIICYGDVICYGDNPKPQMVNGYEAGDGYGFIVDGYAGDRMNDVVTSLSYYHYTTMPISLWRKSEEYVPSSWAEPLPLP